MKTIILLITMFTCFYANSFNLEESKLEYRLSGKIELCKLNDFEGIKSVSIVLYKDKVSFNVRDPKIGQTNTVVVADKNDTSMISALYELSKVGHSGEAFKLLYKQPINFIHMHLEKYNQYIDVDVLHDMEVNKKEIMELNSGIMPSQPQMLIFDHISYNDVLFRFIKVNGSIPVYISLNGAEVNFAECMTNGIKVLL